MKTLTTRDLITGVLVVLSILAFFYLAYSYLAELILVFAGIVISISISPIVEWLKKHKLPRSLSVILIYSSLILFFLGFAFIVIPQMTHQVSTLLPRFKEFYEGMISTFQQSSFLYVRQWAEQLPPSLDSFFVISPLTSAEREIDSVNLTLAAAQSVFWGLFTFSIILLIGFYWTLEGERLEYAFLMLFPTEKRESTRAIIQDIESRVGGYMRGQGLLALALGAMALGAYFLIGLPSVFSLAFLAAIFELIPVFGPALGAIPALLVAAASAPTKIIWVMVAFVFMQLIENNLLAPRIMHKMVGINPIVTILSIIGFGYLFGFPGFWMAIPLAAIIQVVIQRTLLLPTASKVIVPEGRDRLSLLRYETQELVLDIRELIRRKETNSIDDDNDEIEDSIEAIATDLDGLLAQTIQPDHQP